VAIAGCKSKLEAQRAGRRVLPSGLPPLTRGASDAGAAAVDLSQVVPLLETGVRVLEQTATC